MLPDLRSVKAKLTRAWDHFDALENIISAWMKSDLYGLTKEANADFTEHRLLYWCSKELDLETSSLIFGDAIHNLRSSLDHLIYAIAICKSGQVSPPDGRKLAFPITDSPELFAEFCRKRLRSFVGDTKLLTALERVQPHVRKNPQFPPLLRQLREFDDADKHRLLQLAVVQCTGWEYCGTFGDIPPEANPIGFIPYDGELKNGTRVVTIIPKCPTPKLNLQGFKLELGVIVKHELSPTGAEHSHVHSLYRAIELEVGTIIDEILAAVG